MLIEGQRWEINPEFRCNFFKYFLLCLYGTNGCYRWSSDVK
jgi:hypothetical protein